MYQPIHFQENRPEVLHGLISIQPLGLLISYGPAGLIANAIPFRLEEGGLKLTCHVARANSQWKELQQNPDCLVVFQGPQAYVSPGFYPSKAEHGKVVPTWNYIIVQARGRASIIEDAAWIMGQVSALTQDHEATRPAPWAASDAPDDFMKMQLRAIIGIEITIQELSGKWKMSQNRNDADRQGVIASFEDLARRDIADEVKKATGR